MPSKASGKHKHTQGHYFVCGRAVHYSSQCVEGAGADCMFLTVFSQFMFLFGLMKVEDKHSSSD